MLDFLRPAILTGPNRAHGDGITDDTSALQSALDTRKSVYLDEDRTYKITGPLFFRRPGQQFGSATAQGCTLACYGSSNILNTQGMHGVRMKGFRLVGKQADGTPNHTGGFGIYVGTDGSSMARSPMQIGAVDISDLIFDGMNGGINITDVNGINITDIQMAAMRDVGFSLQALDSNHRIDNVRIQSVIYSPTAEARDVGLGIGLLLDGEVHGCVLDYFATVRASYGIKVVNTNAADTRARPAFLFGSHIGCDYPKFEGIYVEDIDRCRLQDVYCHGSETSHGMSFGRKVRDVKIIGANVSGHYCSAISFDGDILDLHAVETDWCSQTGPNAFAAVQLGRNAKNVRIVGGGNSAGIGNAAFGIFRSNPATEVELAAAGQWRGTYGSKNW